MQTALLQDLQVCSPYYRNNQQLDVKENFPHSPNRHRILNYLLLDQLQVRAFARQEWISHWVRAYSNIQALFDNMTHTPQGITESSIGPENIYLHQTN